MLTSDMFYDPRTGTCISPLDRAPYPPLHLMQMPPPSFAMPAQFPESVHAEREGNKARETRVPPAVELQRRLRRRKQAARQPTKEKLQASSSHRHHRQRSVQKRRPTSSHRCHGGETHRASSSHIGAAERTVSAASAVSATEPVEDGLGTHLQVATVTGPRRSTAKATTGDLPVPTCHFGSGICSIDHTPAVSHLPIPPLPSIPPPPTRVQPPPGVGPATVPKAAPPTQGGTAHVGSSAASRLPPQPPKARRSGNFGAGADQYSFPKRYHAYSQA